MSNLKRKLKIISTIGKELVRLFPFQMMLSLIMRFFILSAVTPIITENAGAFFEAFYLIVAMLWLTVPIWRFFRMIYNSLYFVWQAWRLNKDVRKPTKRWSW